jgi:TRAP-type C4-dicarboxylate transport system permease small subunit
MNRYQSFLGRLESSAEFVAGACLVSTTLIVSADAIGRYVFNSPLRWSSELISLYLLPAIFFLELPVSFARHAHVAVDVVIQFASPVIKALSGICVHIAGIVLFLLILIANFERMVSAYLTHEIMPGIYLWPIWPSIFILVVGCTLAIIRCLTNLYGDLQTLIVQGAGAIAVDDILEKPAVE